MNASKEECRKAREGLLRLIESSPSLHKPFGKEIQHLTDFLYSAERKLPSEATYAKARNNPPSPLPCPKCLGNSVVPLPKLCWSDINMEWHCPHCNTDLNEAQRLRLHDAACANAAAEAATPQVPDLPMPKSKHKEGPKGWSEETGM